LMGVDTPIAFDIPTHNRSFAALDAPFYFSEDPRLSPDGEVLAALERVLTDNPRVAAVAPRWAADGVPWNTELDECGCVVSGAKVEVLSAPVMLIRREAISDTYSPTLYDPRFSPIGYEDVDLSLRLRAAGWEIATADVMIPPPAGEHPLDADLAGFHLRNLARLREKWRFYLQERRFDERVLVRREGARGDAFLATAVLAAFREDNPGRVFAFETKCPDIVPLWAEYLPVTSPPAARARRFQPHLTADLNSSYELRPHLHIFTTYALAAGLGSREIKPYLPPCDNGMGVRGGSAPRSPYAVLHATDSSWGGRDWPVERWAEIASWLMAHKGLRVIQVGTVRDPRVPGAEDWRERLPGLRDMAAVMRGAALFVGTDSFPFHVAQAARVPAVALFGCVRGYTRIFSLSAVAVEAKDVACIGCHQWIPQTRIDALAREGRAEPRESSICSRVGEEDACMGGISVEQVRGACEGVMG